MKDENSNPKNQAFEEFSNQLENYTKSDEIEKKRILKDGISNIEKNFQSQINSSKIINSYLSNLKSQINLSSISNSSKKIRSPFIFRRKYIQNLANEIFLISHDLIKENGSILSLSTIKTYFKANRTNWKIRDKDIPEAINWLNEKKLIPSILNKNENNSLIVFTPIELNSDSNLLLSIIDKNQYEFTELLNLLNWNEKRLNSCVSFLQNNGIIVIDNTIIYFPGI